MKQLGWIALVLMFTLCSCGVRHHDFIAFESLESKAKQALREKHFNEYFATLDGDAAVCLSALMLNEDTFRYAAWELTQLTIRPDARVQSIFVFSMSRPTYEDVELSTGINEAITALAMFYPEGTEEFVRISDGVHAGMSWSEARVASARLFGLASLYYRERVRAGKAPMNLDFSDIPNRTVKVGEAPRCFLK